MDSMKKQKVSLIGDRVLEWSESNNSWTEIIKVEGNDVCVNYDISQDSDPSELVKQFSKLDLIEAAKNYTIQNNPTNYQLEISKGFRLRTIIVDQFSIVFSYTSSSLSSFNIILTEHDYNDFCDCRLL